MRLVESSWMLPMPGGPEGLAGHVWHPAGTRFLATTHTSV